MDPFSRWFDSPMMEAARRMLLPFFRVVTYALLFSLVFLSLYVVSVQQTELPPTGFRLWLFEGGSRVLHTPIPTFVMACGFVGLFFFRYKEKFLVLACMVLIAFLGRA